MIEVIAVFQYEGVLLWAITGLVVCAQIVYMKYGPGKRICVRRDDCKSILYGRYSRTLGIPNEYLGAAYFGVMATYAWRVLADASLAVGFVRVAVIAGATAAVLFMWRLVYIQACVIKKWCYWCLAAALSVAFIYWLLTF